MSFGSFRDNLLVTMGARAAYMHDRGDIELPSGVEGERKIADFVVGIVDQYIRNRYVHGNFDNYIEIALTKQYGVIKKKAENENTFDELSKSVENTLAEVKKAISRPDNIVDSAHYGLWKCMQYLERQIQELDRRTR